MNYIQQKLINNPSLQTLLKGSFAPMLSKLLGMFSIFLFYRQVTRNFGEEAIGIFSIDITLLAILHVVSKLGLDTSIVKHVAQLKADNQFGKIKSIFQFTAQTTFLTALVFSFLLLIFSHNLDSIFLSRSYGLYSPFNFLALILPLHSITMLIAEYFRGLENMKYYAFLQSGVVFLIAIVLYFVWPLNYTKLYQPLVIYLLATFLQMIAGFYLLYRARHNHSKQRFGSKKALLSESFPMLLSNSVFFIMNWADIIMLGIFTDESETGIYSNCVKIANLSVVTLYAINAIAAPKFAEFTSKRDLTSLKLFTKTTSKLNILLSLPITLVIVCFPEFLLGIFSEASKLGKWALVLLSLGQFANAAAGSVINVLNMTGREKQAKNIILFTAMLNLALNLFLIPKYGMLGAAMATFVSLFVWNALAVIDIHKHYKFISVTLPWQKIK